MPLDSSAGFALPDDHQRAILVGRVWRPEVAGPSLFVLRDDQVLDISAAAPTMRDLCEVPRPAAFAASARGDPIGLLADVLANTPRASRDPRKPWLLAPVDLQAVKAAGVTFAVSMLERVIEEKARGAPEAAASIRQEIVALVGEDFAKLKPGSPEAMRLKEVLIQQGAWSQYL